MLKVAQFCKKYNVIMFMDFMPLEDKFVITFYSPNRHESHCIETTMEAMVDPKFEDFLVKQAMSEMHYTY